MKKILVATVTSLAVLSAAGCIGKGPGGTGFLGKGKAPPPVLAPAPAPIVTKG